jgi:CBS-domain-containing membrane protein
VPKRDPSHPLWSPVAAAVVTVVPGLLGLALGQLWLFPSLAPTAVMQAHLPEQPSSRPYNIIIAHTAGLLSAYFAVYVFGIAHQPSVFDLHTLSLARVLASGLAVLLAITIEVLVQAQHPPAAATTLLASLGSFRPTWHDAMEVFIGVVIVVIVGEIGRRIRSKEFHEPLFGPSGNR